MAENNTVIYPSVQIVEFRKRQCGHITFSIQYLPYLLQTLPQE